MATTVKVCGITCLGDARTAIEAGADWIGLNLVAGPRLLDVEGAIEIASRLPDVSSAVALVPVTNDHVFAQILRRIGDAGIEKLQLYGDVTTGTYADLRDAGFQTLAVLRVKDRASLDDFSTFLSACGGDHPDFAVLDGFDSSALGGTGQRADWGMIRDARDEGVLAGWPPIILAGGLTPENVAEAIRVLSPSGVDVASGVETSPGEKDRASIEAFVRAAKGAGGY